MWNDQEQVETIEDAIRFAGLMGFEISLEEFDGEEEQFWNVWHDRCEQVERRCHPVFGWD